jgi:serine phosphatase RsbU (regulator of sigma subunit)
MSIIAEMAAETPSIIIDEVFRKLSEFTATDTFQDDVSIVVVKFS